MNDARLKEIEANNKNPDGEEVDPDTTELITALRESQAREAKLRAWASHFRYQVVIREADVELWKGLREALKETKQMVSKDTNETLTSKDINEQLLAALIGVLIGTPIGIGTAFYLAYKWGYL